MARPDPTTAPIELDRTLERDELGRVCRAAPGDGHGAPLWVRLLDREPFDRELFWQHVPPEALGDIPERAGVGPRPPGVIGALGDVPYLAYALPPGGLSLARLLDLGSERKQPLPEPLALYITRELVRGLHHSPGASPGHGTSDGAAFSAHGFLVPQLVWIAESGRVLLLGSEVATPLRACLAAPEFRAAFRRWVRASSADLAAPHPSHDLFALGSLLRRMLAVSLFPAGDRPPAQPWLRPFLLAGLAAAGGGEGQLDGLEQRLGDAMGEAGYRVDAVDLAAHLRGLSARRAPDEAAAPPAEEPAPSEDGVATGSPMKLDPPGVGDLGSDDLDAMTEATVLPYGAATGWSAGDDGAPPEAPAPAPPVPSPIDFPQPGNATPALLPRIPRKALFLATGAAVVVMTASLAHWTLDAVIQPPEGVAPRPSPTLPSPADGPPVEPTPSEPQLTAAPATAAPDAPTPNPAPRAVRRTEPRPPVRGDTPVRPPRSASRRSEPPAPVRRAAEAPPATAPAAVPAPLEETAPESAAAGTADSAPAAAPRPEDNAPAPLSEPAEPTEPIARLAGRGGQLLPPERIEKAPQLRRRPLLEYPPVALRLGAEATLLFRVLVDRRGRVVDVIPASERAGFGFDEAGLTVARQARYEPALAGGRPVRAWTTLSVSYRLPDQSPPAPPPSG